MPASAFKAVTLTPGKAVQHVEAGPLLGQFIVSAAHDYNKGVYGVDFAALRALPGNTVPTALPDPKITNINLSPPNSPQPWFDAKHYENIQRAEEVVVTTLNGKQYAIVADYNFTPNEIGYMDGALVGKQVGGKIGIIENPFGIDGNPRYLGATTPIISAAVQRLNLSPDGKSLTADTLFYDEPISGGTMSRKGLLRWDNVPALIQHAIDNANAGKINKPFDLNLTDIHPQKIVETALPASQGGGNTPIGWINGIASRNTTNVTIDMPARYGDIFKVDLLSIIAKQPGPLQGVTAAEIQKYTDINSSGQGQIVKDGTKILSRQVATGDDASVKIPGSANNYDYVTRKVTETETAEVSETGIFYIAPTLDMEALRNGQRLNDGTVAISFTVWARGDKFQYTFKLNLTDFGMADANNDGQNDAVFFGDRNLENPGYSKFDVNGSVGMGASYTNNPLDVWRVEQRLKYLAFPAMGYVAPGSAGFVGPMQNTNQIQDFKVDGSFGQQEMDALKLFEKVIRYRNPATAGYGVVGDSTFESSTNGADGAIAPGDAPIIAGDANSGNSMDWLSAYNAPHWMDIGAQMQYQGTKEQASFSLPGWSNASGAEHYGVSWVRDLMRAQSSSNAQFLSGLPATGSRFTAAVDGNYGATPGIHKSHYLGMNFDLSIKDYLNTYYMQSANEVAQVISTSNLPDPLATPQNGWQWSTENGVALLSQLPNQVDSLSQGNLQADAVRNLLALYSVTRSDNVPNNGSWDELPVTNGAPAKTALFGDGSQASTPISRAIIGSRTILNDYPSSPTEARLKAIRDVLAALGVNANATGVLADNLVTWPGHQNHFHVDIRPPKLVKIVSAPSNLLATATDAPMVLAATVSNQSSSSATPASPKYDAVLGACQFVEVGSPMGSAINSIPVIAPVGKFLKIGPKDSFNGPVTITVLEQPSHGMLQADLTHYKGDIASAPYHYSPDANYFDGKKEFYKGGDQFSFDVEAQGKHYKVIYQVYVVDIVDFVERGDYPEVNNLCPNPSVSWRISEGGAVTGNESSAMALNDWLMTNQLDALVAAASGVTFSFADLPGAAVGQANANGITLDTNAAGYNWFIDTTPADNSEFLPTSNPNEWVAKAGSAAAGKMDMLSVLLHEYGHALGINHSADPNDFMGTTLTAGVRRLPSAEEMALMQGLVAQAKATLTPTLSQWERGQDQNAPTFPTLPLGTSFIGFLGLLRGSRYGGVSIAPDTSTLVTQYDWAVNATLVNGSLNAADGWSTQGSVNIGSGAAVMNEVSSPKGSCSNCFSSPIQFPPASLAIKQKRPELFSRRAGRNECGRR